MSENVAPTGLTEACADGCVYGTCGGSGFNGCGGCCGCRGGCVVTYEDSLDSPQETTYIEAILEGADPYV